MNMRISLAGSVAAGFLLPAMAWANGGVQFDFARVVSSEPVVRQVTVKTPYQECWQEQQVISPPPPRSTVAPTLAGALIGGIIGNQFGGGDGKIYTTVAGALIGSTLSGAQAARQNAAAAQAVPEVYNVERCETRYNFSQEERIDGYDVRYEYRGQIYQTRMSEPPGKRIKVRVVVSPINSN